MRKANYSIRYIAGQPAKKISNEVAEYSSKPNAKGILSSEDDLLCVMVWNIYKQQRTNWLHILNQYGKSAQLVILQEAHTTPELIQFSTENYQSVDQVPAVRVFEHHAGVMTLATTDPIYCCPLREREPFLRFAKSALVTIYPFFAGQLLMVVNIHAINFSLGVNVYSRQLDPIGLLISSHKGPVIMAGDFNTWNRKRVYTLYRFAREIGLHEVNFESDQRKRVFGYPLDFIFYNNLTVVNASVLETTASDHNPLLVDFGHKRDNR